ncbi:MAG: FhaA domain-containing protein, partial [Gordonibacter urolithinfaciens]
MQGHTATRVAQARTVDAHTMPAPRTMRRSAPPPRGSPPGPGACYKGDAMGFLSRFEGKMEDTFEGAADRMANAPISPVQIAKKAEKQMRREKMVGAGKQY